MIQVFRCFVVSIFLPFVFANFVSFRFFPLVFTIQISSFLKEKKKGNYALPRFVSMFFDFQSEVREGRKGFISCISKSNNNEMSLLRRALRSVGLRVGKDRYLVGTDLEGE